MKTIHITHPHEYKEEQFPKLSVALGFFDGVHKGHQEVICTAKKWADENGCKSAVMTFHPHPSVVLQRHPITAAYMTPMHKKAELIAELGVDYLFIVSFTPDFAELTPQQFVDYYIIGLHAVHVVAGFDFSYGRLGKGTMETLPFHSRESFIQTEVNSVDMDEQKVSSTRLRRVLSEGSVQAFPELTGRFYEMEGIVVHGDKRGRTIGFPTANIQLEESYVIPKIGVYGVKVRIDENWYDGICNIGYKPTFYEKLENPTIEVHLLQFDDDIYGKSVSVQWYFRLRDERKFSGLEALKKQLQCDKYEAEQRFLQLLNE